jgi:hypothetical protein
MARLERAGWQYSISVRRQYWIKNAITAIDEGNWQPLADYPEGGEAQIAETTVAGERPRAAQATGAAAASAPTQVHGPLKKRSR